ncbi:MAG: class I SAM-dependent methyltransferase [Gammaproteobacteria bacterium]|nr:class I SAM-dependent methyltransferase [Gammaproteobacteria bacterium]
MRPADYEAWYRTPRGRWIAARETALMRRLMRPGAGERALDVGCGTGHFTRRLARLGLETTGLDPDPAMLVFARAQGGGIEYVLGRGAALPFPDAAFDHTVAVTSLCFIADPARALREMWRVARRGVTLGLLNRDSLLHRRKAGRGGYAGARWDTPADAHEWAATLQPAPRRMQVRSAVFVPSGSWPARIVESLVPARLPLGAFLAVHLEK